MLQSVAGEGLWSVVVAEKEEEEAAKKDVHVAWLQECKCGSRRFVKGMPIM